MEFFSNWIHRKQIKWWFLDDNSQPKRVSHNQKKRKRFQSGWWYPRIFISFDHSNHHVELALWIRMIDWSLIRSMKFTRISIENANGIELNRILSSNSVWIHLISIWPYPPPSPSIMATTIKASFIHHYWMSLILALLIRWCLFLEREREKKRVSFRILIHNTPNRLSKVWSNSYCPFHWNFNLDANKTETENGVDYSIDWTSSIVCSRFNPFIQFILYVWLKNKKKN